ncbi:transposase [Kamptonema cortianum]|uniref:Transposase n=1 Tax=Geitlerinema calcuttense NRMC-F 0142 TaxID=2922238 RepID=A0ABT7LWP6_9CYAN|nr:transposase [Geitlerinema calcuttense]MDK3159045.1 transposase [Kamptonema cortianum]MDL5056438.1 transposase [Geitlerinema calcuttense NRMC-F 0142]
MPPRKLSESEKNEILSLYRETPETTSTLATRYGVSNSTISRLLKSRLPAAEYEILVQQKRAAAGKGQPPQLFDLEAMKTQPSDAVAEDDDPEEEVAAAINLPTRYAPARQESEILESPLADETYQGQASALKELLGEDLLLDREADLEEDDEEDEDFDDDDDEDYLDDEDDEEEEYFPPKPILARSKNRKSTAPPIEVLPLAEANIPKICYLVIDRAAELITRPLRDFGDLGDIPDVEELERTLPIFDNHRVARRFSKRSQRVIKVPDGRMFHKVGEYLQAKGITRLLIDGQVYSL